MKLIIDIPKAWVQQMRKGTFTLEHFADLCERVMYGEQVKDTDRTTANPSDEGAQG